MIHNITVNKILEILKKSIFKVNICSLYILHLSHLKLKVCFYYMLSLIWWLKFSVVDLSQAKISVFSKSAQQLGPECQVSVNKDFLLRHKKRITEKVCNPLDPKLHSHVLAGFLSALALALFIQADRPLATWNILGRYALFWHTWF